MANMVKLSEISSPGEFYVQPDEIREVRTARGGGCLIRIGESNWVHVADDVDTVLRKKREAEIFEG